MPQTLLGIDLGSYSIKIVQIQRSFGEFKLQHFYELPPIAEGVLDYHQAASAAIAKFFSEHPVAYDSCIVPLPGSMVSFRNLNLPFRSIKKIDQTLAFELESLIPFELEELLYDYAVLSQDETSSQVLAAYLREEDFKSFLSQIQLSECDPRYVGVDTVDLSYLTHLGVLPPEGSYAILDLGHRRSNFLILEGNQIRSLRCFSWGGNRVTQALVRETGLGYEDAEKHKHQTRLIEEPQDASGHAILSEFEQLAQELRQTLFAYYESGHAPIQALYLSGGASRMSGVDAFFSHRLNINVSPLEVLDESFHELTGDLEQIQAIIPTALAAGLHGVFPNKGAAINFRRGSYAYRKDFEALGGTLKRLGVFAGAVAAIAIVSLGVSYWTLSGQVNKMNESVAARVRTAVKVGKNDKIDTPEQALKTLDGKIASLSDELKKIQGEEGPSALEIFRMVSAAMPPRSELKVDVDEIVIGPTITLSGTTVAYPDLDKINEAMKAIKEFKNVKVVKSDKQNDRLKFSLSWELASREELGEKDRKPVEEAKEKPKAKSRAN